jgi:hypothetical protein
MQFFRDSCELLKYRTTCSSLICAKVIQLSPFTVEDWSDRISFEIDSEEKNISVGDCAYFLLNFIQGEFVCERYTLVPDQLIEVHRYQVEESQAKEFDSNDGRRSLGFGS